jgi:hypothetical protein
MVVSADEAPGPPGPTAWRPVEKPLPAILEKLAIPPGSSPEATLAAMPMPEPSPAPRAAEPPPVPVPEAAEAGLPDLDLEPLGPVEEEAAPEPALAAAETAAPANAGTAAAPDTLDIVDSLPPELDTLMEEDPVPLGGRPDSKGRAAAPTLDEIIARALGPLGTDAEDKASRR